MKAAQEGDLVLLKTQDHKTFLVTLKAGMRVQTHQGIVLHDDLIGQALGRKVQTHIGRSLLVLEPSTYDLIQQAKRIQLDAICLTDHNHVWDLKAIEDLKQKHGFHIFGANEITTDQGDMLVFGMHTHVKGIIKLTELRKWWMMLMDS